jgi:predicted phosphoribosyltransferase
MTRFTDRHEAGRAVADRLALEGFVPEAVYAIPRGGLEIGAEVSLRFDCPLLPVFVTKVRHPLEPELAVGAIDEDERVHLREVLAGGRLTPGELDHAIRRASARLNAQREAFARAIPRFDPRNRRIVVVDDGLATGETARAALRFLRARHAGELAFAVPVASLSGVSMCSLFCDRFFTATPPDAYLLTIGEYYENFPQLTSEDAFAILLEVNGRSRNLRVS